VLKDRQVLKVHKVLAKVLKGLEVIQVLKVH
jgi:hypothetical protein